MASPRFSQRKRDAAGRHDRREEDGVRAAEADGRQDQVPLRPDRQEQQQAGRHAGHAQQDDRPGAEPLRPAAGEHAGDDGRDGVDHEEQPDPRDAQFRGVGPQEDGGQPQADAHRHADRQHHAGMVAAQQAQQRGAERPTSAGSDAESRRWLPTQSMGDRSRLRSPPRVAAQANGIEHNASSPATTNISTTWVRPTESDPSSRSPSRVPTTVAEETGGAQHADQFGQAFGRAALRDERHRGAVGPRHRAAIRDAQQVDGHARVASHGQVGEARGREQQQEPIHSSRVP